MSPLAQLHGALFTAWVVLFIMQTALIASHRTHVHRRLDDAGAVQAAAMVVVAGAAIASAARGGVPPGVDPLAFLCIPMFDMLLFATLVSAALLRRRERETHKRLMLVAYISLMATPIARFPGLIAYGPSGVLRDWRSCFC